MKNGPIPLLFVFVCLFIASQPAVAQTGEEEVYIVFSPLALMDVVTPSVQFGAEYRPLSWLGFQLEPTIPLRYTLPEHEEDRYRYWKIKGEVRFYVVDHFDGDYYIAPEFGFITKSMDLTNGFFRNEADMEFSYSYSHINQMIFITGLKFGKTYELWRFRLDGYTGLGARFHNTRYSNMHGVRESQIFDEPDLWLASYRYAGKKVFPHVSLGVKIGFGVVKPDA